MEGRSRDSDPRFRDNDSFIMEQLRQHDDLHRERERDLEALEGSLGTLQEMGKNIGVEIEVQNDMIDKLDADVEKTQGRFATAIRRIEDLIDKTSEKTSWLIVAVLSVILVLVVIAVVFPW